MKRRLLLIVVASLLAVAPVACSSSHSSANGDNCRDTPGASCVAKDGPPESTAAASGSKGCVPGTQALAPGRSEHKMSTGGFERDYVVYVGTGYSQSKPAPLVFNFHGLTSPIAGQELISDFHAKADQVGAVEVLPLGRGAGTVPAWNVTKYPDWPDDKAFVADLLDSMEKEACVDTNRVFAIGLSNGAQMTSFVACNLADRFAAFATVAGLYNPGLGTPDCAPARPVPIIAFHGTADPFLPFNGGSGTKVATLPLDNATLAGIGGLAAHLKPIPDVAAAWAKFDGCSAQPNTTPVPNAPHVKLETWTGCKAGSVVDLYVIDGAGHTWPGSKGSEAVASVTGPTNMEINANDLIWTFFTEHPLPI